MESLVVDNLQTHIAAGANRLRVVDGVSFTLRRGEVLGLVGESGSGKTVTGFSILGLIEPPLAKAGGKVYFDSEDLLAASPARLRELRGGRIAMIFQDPLSTLNPVLRVETQMIETVLAHDRMADRASARERARATLARVGIAAPDARLAAYPHQLSGGMRQRVAIAIALLNDPELIIADEPTTALDVTIQSQILFEMQKLARANGTALVWITHDLGVVAGLADSVCVMYAGRIVERGPVDALIDSPLHPYTRGLIASLPARNVRGAPLAQIAGRAPSLAERPSGCAFRDRCERASARCTVEPPETPYPGNRGVRCFHPYAA